MYLKNHLFRYRTWNSFVGNCRRWTCFLPNPQLLLASLTQSILQGVVFWITSIHSGMVWNTLEPGFQNRLPRREMRSNGLNNSRVCVVYTPQKNEARSWNMVMFNIIFPEAHSQSFISAVSFWGFYIIARSPTDEYSYTAPTIDTEPDHEEWRWFQKKDG